MGRNRKKKLSPVQRRNRNAKARGRNFEIKTAKDLDGYVYNGQNGDVQYPGPNGDMRGECKYQSGLKGYGRLSGHIDQAIRNVDGEGLPWSLHITGGRSYRNAQSFTLIPTSFYKDLIDRATNGTAQADLRDLIRDTVTEVMDER